VPTPLTWPGSCIVHDIKGENRGLTSDFHARHSRVRLKRSRAPQLIIIRSAFPPVAAVLMLTECSRTRSSKGKLPSARATTKGTIGPLVVDRLRLIFCNVVVSPLNKMTSKCSALSEFLAGISGHIQPVESDIYLLDKYMNIALD